MFLNEITNFTTGQNPKRNKFLCFSSQNRFKKGGRFFEVFEFF